MIQIVLDDKSEEIYGDWRLEKIGIAIIKLEIRCGMIHSGSNYRERIKNKIE